MNKQARYLAEIPDALVVRPLDDITLIYHRPSGQTHLTVSPVPEILAAMQAMRSAATAVDIMRRLSTDFDLGDPVQAETEIAAHLEELAALGLIKRA